ncbi:hormogonium polysaccharide secretion pseudopilin HpsB [Coleofasciculus sp. FACHB-SPT36]|uniref:hormogonium polysaccharide secretion pseudopilin HpsB n=1 Tax=Cyanophyceae TaxID=3028117 RepID=UPI00168AF0F9|nr:hormogonium polysaccharide secretion pseudopilin HpsB [Coleofasciculus sp. FACHB-SPT36]MBD2541609.1 type II secretion system protein [Coleofasciculus sp. FACHB-SPT36]
MIKPKQQQPISQSSQGGFTIIESLLAIIVVTILMVGLTPVIVLSVATRVQAKRVERGTDAARAYIDGLRSGAITAPTPTSASFNPDAPSGSLTCTANATYCSSPASTYCINLDETVGCSPNSLSDLVVQGFRTATTSTDGKEGYRLGVRVYRADAFSPDFPGSLKKNNPDKVTQSTYSGGLGDRKAPLFETTTEIAGSDTSLKTLCDRIKVNNPSNPSSSCS